MQLDQHGRAVGIARTAFDDDDVVAVAGIGEDREDRRIHAAVDLLDTEGLDLDHARGDRRDQVLLVGLVFLDAPLAGAIADVQQQLAGRLVQRCQLDLVGAAGDGEVQQHDARQAILVAAEDGIPVGAQECAEPAGGIEQAQQAFAEVGDELVTVDPAIHGAVVFAVTQVQVHLRKNPAPDARLYNQQVQRGARADLAKERDFRWVETIVANAVVDVEAFSQDEGIVGARLDEAGDARGVITESEVDLGPKAAAEVGRHRRDDPDGEFLLVAEFHLQRWHGELDQVHRLAEQQAQHGDRILPDREGQTADRLRIGQELTAGAAGRDLVADAVIAVGVDGVAGQQVAEQRVAVQCAIAQIGAGTGELDGAQVDAQLARVGTQGIEQIDQADGAGDPLGGLGHAAGDHLRQVQQGNVAPGQVRDDGQREGQDVDHGLDRAENRLDVLQHAADEVADELAEVQLDVLQRHLRNAARHVLAAEGPGHGEIGTQRGEAALALITTALGVLVGETERQRQAKVQLGAGCRRQARVEAGEQCAGQQVVQAEPPRRSGDREVGREPAAAIVLDEHREETQPAQCLEILGEPDIQPGRQQVELRVRIVRRKRGILQVRVDIETVGAAHAQPQVQDPVQAGNDRAPLGDLEAEPRDAEFKADTGAVGPGAAQLQLEVCVVDIPRGRQLGLANGQQHAVQAHQDVRFRRSPVTIKILHQADTRRAQELPQLVAHHLGIGRAGNQVAELQHFLANVVDELGRCRQVVAHQGQLLAEHAVSHRVTQRRQDQVQRAHQAVDAAEQVRRVEDAAEVRHREDLARVTACQQCLEEGLQIGDVQHDVALGTAFGGRGQRQDGTDLAVDGEIQRRVIAEQLGEFVALDRVVRIEAHGDRRRPAAGLVAERKAAVLDVSADRADGQRELDGRRVGDAERKRQQGRRRILAQESRGRERIAQVEAQLQVELHGAVDIERDRAVHVQQVAHARYAGQRTQAERFQVDVQRR